ncbi:ethanolamine ammonia-lyase subunit EutC [Urbifossiella limnaea]|uniref:Ethanolamine ammonia-lyase small subunit n=1 Tax=Urbifossiella limnaea TaxID=2528023 RepID=A0A517Y0Y8_9BACT|nr:ethanolamine ammonia-lyase subunit EutC [Urbifossiella limnaea]QDU23420.1 Ethanolamine ammonia-lyase light chain [Urbifossiella limnaea]
MSDAPLSPLDPVAELLARTPARVLAGRAGPGYRTATWLQLREDHAAARDAVHAELDLDRLGPLVDEYRLFAVNTHAGSRTEFLTRPDLGRRLDGAARERVTAECPRGADLQVVIGDGLSATAVAAQVPALLPLLAAAAAARGWTFGRPFAVWNCRVGVLNDVGELLDPAVVVLLIGERPGLATAESLSAYLAYRPRPGHTDADRNLVSNVHARGVSPADAARRVAALAAAVTRAGASGVGVKEELPGLAATIPPPHPGELP